jgi:hypothetical protein
MNNCRVCGGPAGNDGDHLCNQCRELESKAERFVKTRPRQALEFFRDLVILAGQTLRAEAGK